jgi:hypothetical protein
MLRHFPVLGGAADTHGARNRAAIAKLVDLIATPASLSLIIGT